MSTVSAPNEAPAGQPNPADVGDMEARRQAKMQYAWNWFQYHADQRLKAFNYFVLFLAALLLAYGTAMKEYSTALKDDAESQRALARATTPAKSQRVTEPDMAKHAKATRPEVAKGAKATELETTKIAEAAESEATNDEKATARARSYSTFAAIIALCGAVISGAFLCIEVRNAELVECGREWLDKLEVELGMKLREQDHKRVHLGKALRLLKAKTDSTPRMDQLKSDRCGQWWDVIFTHKLWFRLIYIVAIFGFFAAAWWSNRGFN